MYIDTYVVSGLAIVALTCVFLGVCVRYAYLHIKKDIEENSGA